jgi:hypothetical protein
VFAIVPGGAASGDAAAAAAAAAACPAGRACGLRGEYFRARDWNGSSLAFTRVDPVVSFDWGEGAPDPRLPADDFQIRWTGFLEPPATGTYTFVTRSDDGVRLWVDERLLVSRWDDHMLMEDEAAIALERGRRVPIKLDHYEHGRRAAVELLWIPPGGSGARAVLPAAALSPPSETNGLAASYFAGKNFETPLLSRRDLDVHFEWRLDSPDPSVPGDRFSARWTGTVEPRHSETYTFHVRVSEANEGVRLSVAGQRIIDGWTAPFAVERSGAVALRAGERVPLALEYNEDVGAASIELAWSSPSQPRVVVSWHRLRP